MQRVALINGTNKNKDYDLAKIFKSLANSGVVEGLEVQAGKVISGYAFIDIVRDGIIFPILFENSADVIIDTTGTTKVYIEVTQSNIDDGTSNSSDGTGIGSIKTGISYPTSNYIPLADIVGGVITDERVDATLKARNLAGLNAFLLATADGTFEVQKADKTLGKINLLDVLINGAGIGSANGIAGLGADGKVPLGQLPSMTVADASQTVKGILKTSTPALASAGVDDTTAMTPKQVKDYYGKVSFATRISMTNNVTYTATTDGIAYGYCSTSSSAIYGYINGGIVVYQDGGGNGAVMSVCWAVRNGETYKIGGEFNTAYGKFVPLN